MEEQVGTNKLWNFGCSISYGSGCNEGEEYYEKYPERRTLKFFELLSNKLGLSPENCGVPGASNEIIIHNIIEHIPLMSKGDFVFIGKTEPSRTFLFNNEYNWTNGKKIYRRFIPAIVGLSDIIIEKGYTPKFMGGLVEYIHESRLMRINHWTDYYDSFYNSIVRLIEERGCSVIVWDAISFCVDGSTITKETKGDVIDSHLSWYGHNELYNHLLNEVKLKFKFGG